jgi:hypothetical protein
MVFHSEVLLSKAVPLFVSMTISGILCGIINHYITNKALGMQTLYDRVLKDLIKVFSLFNVFLTTSLIVGHLFWPVPNFIAILLFLCYMITIYILATAVFVTLCVRYMSVYHTNIIDLVDENQLIWYLRLSVVATVMLMLITELSMFNSKNSYYVYYILTTGNPEESYGRFEIIPYLAIIDFLGAVFLHFRLEYDAIMVYEENHNITLCNICSITRALDNNAAEDQSEDGYSLNTNRIFICVCIVLLVSPIVVLQVLGRVDVFSINVIIHYVMFSGIPLLAIGKNGKLKKHAKNMFVTCFTQVQTMFTVNV